MLITRLFFTFVLILCIHISRGQISPGASVSGTVVSTSGEPVPGASLFLKKQGKGVAADAQGRFTIEGLTAGTYTLEVSSLGFAPQHRTFTLQKGQSLALDLTLLEQAFQMNEVNVQGKSRATELKEQGYAITALSVKEFKNSSLDVSQVLDRVSGVRILEEGGLGSDFSFTLNGFSGKQVKFFMDGLPMDNLGPSLSLNNIPVNMLERIEVYKGVVPVWLGTDALGGAVNIVTSKKRNFLDASYSFGSFNTHRTSVNAAYTDPRSGFTMRTNIFHNYSDNNYKVYVPIQDLETRYAGDTQEVERFHDRYRSGMISLQTGWVNRGFADNLLLGVIASANDKEIQTGATMSSVYGAITSNSKTVVPSLRYSKKDLFAKGLDFSLYTAYNISENQIIDTTTGIRYNWTGDFIHNPNSNEAELFRTFTTMNDHELLTQANLGYVFNPRHSLALNYSYTDFTRKTYDAEDPDNPDHRFPRSLSKQIAGLAYKFDFNEKWTTTVFAKMYLMTAETFKHFDFGLETQRTEAVRPRKQNYGYGGATSYLLAPGLRIKASYEHTFRMPESTEFFGNGLFVQPNPDLGPEQSDNFNLGGLYQFRFYKHHQISLESNFIYRKANDLIYQIVTVSNPQTSYGNISKTRTIGVEGSIRYSWKDLFNAGANITFQDITDQAERVYNESYTNSGYQKNYNYGLRLPNKPFLFGNAHATVFFKDFLKKGNPLSVNYTFNYVERYFLSWAHLGSASSKKIIPRQFAHNIGLSYSLQDGRYNISLECSNLTDNRLYDKFFLQKPGRAFYIKLRYSIGS